MSWPAWIFPTATWRPYWTKSPQWAMIDNWPLETATDLRPRQWGKMAPSLPTVLTGRTVPPVFAALKKTMQNP